jgi:programmed cell death 8 (apoptosis-inducing factor)
MWNMMANVGRTARSMLVVRSALRGRQPVSARLAAAGFVFGATTVVVVHERKSNVSSSCFGEQPNARNMKSKYEHIIIGGGTSATTAMERIRELEPDADILVIGDLKVNYLRAEQVAQSLELKAQTNANFSAVIDVHGDVPSAEISEKILYAAPEMTLSELFHAMDTSGDGLLSPSELRVGLMKFNIELQQPALQGLIDVIDVNKDGMISFAEFFEFFSGNRRHSYATENTDISAMRSMGVDSNATGGMTLLVGHTVTSVDIGAKTICLSASTGPLPPIQWGKLLFATGGEKAELPHGLEDYELEKVLNFTSKADWLAIERLCTERDLQNITVVGGGPLGTTIASKLVDERSKSGKQFKITQIFTEGLALGRYLPYYAAETATQRVQDLGVDVRSQTAVVGATVSANGQLRLSLQSFSRDTLETDYVIYAPTQTPAATGVAKTAGLELDGINGGIVANLELAARSDVYVAGEAVSFYDPLLGYRRRVSSLDHSLNSAQLAAANMCGGREIYTHTPIEEHDCVQMHTEAVGSCNPGLETVGFWETTSKNVDSPNSGANTPAVEQYQRGVVYFLDKAHTVCGVLLCNVGGIDLAKSVLAEDTAYTEPEHRHSLQVRIPVDKHSAMRYIHVPAQTLGADKLAPTPNSILPENMEAVVRNNYLRQLSLRARTSSGLARHGVLESASGPGSRAPGGHSTRPLALPGPCDRSFAFWRMIPAV